MDVAVSREASRVGGDDGGAGADGEDEIVLVDAHCRRRRRAGSGVEDWLGAQRVPTEQTVEHLCHTRARRHQQRCGRQDGYLVGGGDATERRDCWRRDEWREGGRQGRERGSSGGEVVESRASTVAQKAGEKRDK